MWKVIKLRKCGNALEALDEFVESIGTAANIHIAVYDLEEGHLVMACGDRRIGDKLHLSSTVNGDIKRAARGKLAVLAYNFADETVALLDSAPELGPICAILCCVADMAIQNEAQSHGSCGCHGGCGCACHGHHEDDSEFGERPFGFVDDDDDPDDETPLFKNGDNGAYTSAIGGGIFGGLSKLLD